jgi:hypothetical protein
MVYFNLTTAILCYHSINFSNRFNYSINVIIGYNI